MQLPVSQGKPHQTLAARILLSGRDLFQPENISVEAAHPLDVLSSDVLIHVVVTDDSLIHAEILRHLYTMF